MVNQNFLLEAGVNNELTVSGNGLKTYNVNPFNLPVGTRGSFKITTNPSQIQSQYMSTTLNVNSATEEFKLFMASSGTQNTDKTGNKLSDIPDLFVNHDLPDVTNVSDVTIPSTGRKVTYRTKININEDVKEVPQTFPEYPELDQVDSYMLKAVPAYDTVFKNVGVKNGLIPTIGDNFNYVKRTTLFYILVKQSTQLKSNAGYVATGTLSHYVPYYTTIDEIEFSLRNDLTTDRHCQRVLDCSHGAEEVFNVLNKPVIFTVDPRFNALQLELNQSITVNCDIEYSKYDDFDNNSYAGLVIRKMHQSFRSNNANKYILVQQTDSTKFNLQSLNTLSLIDHEYSPIMTINDLVLSSFVDAGLNTISESNVNYMQNLIHTQKDIMVFNSLNNNQTLYSLKSYPEYVITPEQNVNFVSQPMYNKNGAFYTVYLYQLIKQVTLPLGVEVLGSNACGALLKSKVGNQMEYFDYVVKPNNRLVFWSMNHTAEEQVYISMTTLFLEKSGSNYVITNQNALNNYDLVSQSSPVGVPTITWIATLKSNKNISLTFTKIVTSEPNYTLLSDSIKFNMDGLRNVLKFNILNVLPFDVELIGDKTIFDEINPYTGTYAVLANNNDVAVKDSLTVCIRQAFNPNLWDIKSFSDWSVSGYDV